LSNLKLINYFGSKPGLFCTSQQKFADECLSLSRLNELPKARHRAKIINGKTDYPMNEKGTEQIILYFFPKNVICCKQRR
jgi:hypothetical protein